MKSKRNNLEKGEGKITIISQDHCLYKASSRTYETVNSALVGNTLKPKFPFKAHFIIKIWRRIFYMLVGELWAHVSMTETKSLEKEIYNNSSSKMFGMKQNVVDGGKNALLSSKWWNLISFRATLKHERSMSFSNEELMEIFSAKLTFTKN